MTARKSSREIELICAFHTRVLDMNRSQGVTHAAGGAVLFSTIACFIVGRDQDEPASFIIKHLFRDNDPRRQA